MRATYLIAATGFLSQPRLPDIEGVGDFAGTVVHSARWDDSDVELAGKRVAIIGTGATAVQLIPELAKQAGHLTVFQRTPIWVTPKLDREMPRLVQRAVRGAPFTQRLGAQGQHQRARADHGRRRAALPPGQGVQPRRRAAREAAPAPPGRRPRAAPQADAGLLLRLQATDVLQRLLPRVHPRRTSTSRPRRSSGSRRPASSSPTAASVESTCWCWPPASTCGTPTSRRSGSSAARARTSASGGARPGSRPTRASRSRASRTCSTSPRRTPTPACRSSRPSRRQMKHMRPAAHRGTPPRRPHLRGHRPGQRGVPRLGHRAARRLGVRPRLLRHRAQLLLQPARRGRAAAADLDDQHAPGRRRASRSRTTSTRELAVISR